MNRISAKPGVFGVAERDGRFGTVLAGVVAIPALLLLARK